MYPRSVQKALTKHVQNNSKWKQTGSKIDPQIINNRLKCFPIWLASDVEEVGEDWFVVPPGAPLLESFFD